MTINWQQWFDKWELESLKITTPFAVAVWKPSELDRDAALELYIELLSQITTQCLVDTNGDEKTALDNNIHDLFSVTRSIIKQLRSGLFRIHQTG